MADSQNVNIENLFNKDALATNVKGEADSGEWMTVQEASIATGISAVTLRRYIKARKLKSRKLGKFANARLQIWITSSMLSDDSASDPEIQEVDTEIEEDAALELGDQADYSNPQSLSWLQRKLDEKDNLLREKDAKIDRLQSELAGASYRNGYLEAEHNSLQKQVLLLEDSQRTQPPTSTPVEPETVSHQKPRSGGLGLFLNWFMGKK